jgi:AraC-like DNA-binding protein
MIVAQGGHTFGWPSCYQIEQRSGDFLCHNFRGLLARKVAGQRNGDRRDSRADFFRLRGIEVQVVDLNGFSACSFSTNATPAKERADYWRESFGRQIVRVDFVPDSDVPLEAACTLRAMPGLRTVSLRMSPARLQRSRRLLADDEDDAVGILIAQRGKATTSQLDRELTMSAGDAFILLHGEAAAMTHSTLGLESVLVPRNTLVPLVRDVEMAAMRPLPRDSEPLKLLTVYMKSIKEDLALASPAMRTLAATHVQDLMAMIIGASRDGAEIAGQRGLRAARLAAVKADVTAHLAQQPDLTLEDVAGRQGLGPRYIQKLFEADGSTFSSFLLEQKLAGARRMLTDARYATSTISAIAFAAGFGDLSYFHRMYRRRYGATPAETRNDARGPNKAN